MPDDLTFQVTPWSKTPTRQLEPVDVELVAIDGIQQLMILLNKRNGFSMALYLNSAEIEHLTRALTALTKRFKKERA